MSEMVPGLAGRRTLPTTSSPGKSAKPPAAPRMS